MNLKQYLLAIGLLAFAQFSQPYIVTIDNKTDGGLEAVITRAGPGVCSSLTALVRPGATKDVDCGFCCPTEIAIEKFSGSNPGVRDVSEPPSTGAGIACQGSTLQVIDAGKAIAVSYR